MAESNGIEKAPGLGLTGLSLTGTAAEKRQRLAEELSRGCLTGQADFHLHSRASDGQDHPAELVKKAHARGLRQIALTDHDGVGGLAEALAMGQRLGLSVIPGIELSAVLVDGELEALCGVERLRMHILGYGIDVENKALKEALAWMLEQRQKRNEQLLAYLADQGIRLTLEDLRNSGGDHNYIGKPNIARALVKAGKIETAQAAFRPGGYLNNPVVREIRRAKLPAEQAIGLINGAGGLAVLAHPIKLRAFAYEAAPEQFPERLRWLLTRLKEYGLAGLECRYSKHPRRLADRLSELAAEMDLIGTCGSDYHGADLGTAWLKIGVTELPPDGPGSAV